MNKRLILLIYLCVSAQALGLGLAPAMLKASNEYPEISASELRLMATEKELQAIWMSWLPTPSVTYNQTFGDTTVDGMTTDTDAEAFNYGIVWTIFDGGARIFEYRSTEHRFEAQEFNHELLRMTLAETAAKTWWTYFTADGAIDTINQIVRDIETLIGKATNNETKDSLDRFLNENRISLRNQVTNRDKARVQFRQYIGEDPNLGLYGDLYQVPWRQQKFNKDKLDTLFIVPALYGQALEVAQVHSPKLNAARANIDAARDSTKAARSRIFGPKVSLSARRGWRDPDSGSRSHSDSVQFQVTIPFSFGAIPKSEASALRERASWKDFDVAVLQIRSDMELAYLGLEQLESNVMALEALYERAFKAVKGHLQKPIKDVSITQFKADVRQVRSLSLQFSQAVSSLVLTRIRIHILMGTLFDELNRFEVNEATWQIQ